MNNIDLDDDLILISNLNKNNKEDIIFEWFIK